MTKVNGSSWHYMKYGLVGTNDICGICRKSKDCVEPCIPEWRAYCEKCQGLIRGSEPCYSKRVGRRNKHTVLYCVQCYEGLWL